MGYTHYWYKAEELPQDKWALFVSTLKLAIEASGIRVAFEGNTPKKKPVLTDKLVRFNGVPGHETFYFERVVDPAGFIQRDETGKVFGFCKTRQDEYDTVVVAALVLAKHYFGGLVDISSDGDMDGADWAEGKQLAKRVLDGLGPKDSGS